MELQVHSAEETLSKTLPEGVSPRCSHGHLVPLRVDMPRTGVRRGCLPPPCVHSAFPRVGPAPAPKPLSPRQTCHPQPQLTVPGTYNKSASQAVRQPHSGAPSCPLRLPVEALPTLGAGAFVTLTLAKTASSLCFLPCQAPRSLSEPGFGAGPWQTTAARHPCGGHLFFL